jgi:hypothetical protein
MQQRKFHNIACTHIQVAVGEKLVVVGNTAQLGDWDEAKGLPLQWSEGHVWTGPVSVTADSKVSYKFVKISEDSSAEWEAGEDRTLSLQDMPEPAIAVHAAWGVAAAYSGTEVNDAGLVCYLHA